MYVMMAILDRVIQRQPVQVKGFAHHDLDQHPRELQHHLDYALALLLLSLPHGPNDHL